MSSINNKFIRVQRAGHMLCDEVEKTKKSKSKCVRTPPKCDVPDIKKIFERECKDFGGSYHPIVFDAVDKIVVFGDIHGDYELAIEMLQAASLIDDDYNWIGKDAYVVQVGDQVDRCRPIPGGPVCKEPSATKNDEDSDVKIMELFNKLDRQAQAVKPNPGRVISLLGNHELLNATGFMNYVSYEGLKGFENYQDPETGEVFEDGMEGRIHAFAAGNQYAKMLGCTRYPAVIIGSNIFVHAGIIDGLINDMNIKDASDLEEINIKLRLWLLGLMEESCISQIIDNRDINSMFWTRALGKIKPGVPLDSPECMDNLSHALKIFHMADSGGNVRMMIGHTPQSFLYSNDINATCGNRIWRVDNGSSKAFDSFDPNMSEHNEKINSRRPQYLLILKDSEYFVCDKDGCKKEHELRLIK
jgi:Calcineurin-like phosphoesterase